MVEHVKELTPELELTCALLRRLMFADHSLHTTTVTTQKNHESTAAPQIGLLTLRAHGAHDS